MIRVVAALVSCSLLVGCIGNGRTPPKDMDRLAKKGKRYHLEDDIGPAHYREVPDIAKIPDAVPKHEPKSKIGNPKTYTVFRKMYKVMPSSKGYVENGKASWYGKKFHGYRTSNGEIYDMYGMSAAHKTLPLPTYAKVTNLANGRSVIVKINDRGPFHEDRLIDLSYSAASKLGILAKGVGNVRVEAIDPKAIGIPLKQKYLRVGNFKREEHAKELALKVQRITKNHPVSIHKRTATKDKTFHVQIGPLNDEEVISKLRNVLLSNKMPNPTIVQMN